MKTSKYIILLPLLFILQIAQSQNKAIKGDTLIWFNFKKELVNHFDLLDFQQQGFEFAFRYWSQGQVVQVYKSKDQLKGAIYNYVYHTLVSRKDTLFEKIELDSATLLKIYDTILKSEIIALKSDNEIDGWSQGYDGITYVIEHSNTDEYSIKNYWTPKSQNSVKEAQILLRFINETTRQLSLKELYSDYRQGLPKRGCFNSGGMTQICYKSNQIGLGYIGSTMLPYGIKSNFHTNYISNIEANLGIEVLYKFDAKNNYEFGIHLSKSNILSKGKNIDDFLIYNYQNRYLRFLDFDYDISNHIINYGFSFNDFFAIGLGFNYLNADKNNIGTNIYASKWFNNIDLSAFTTTTLYNNGLDYKIGISKSINFRKQKIISGNVQVYFENFIDYNDINLGLTLLL